MIADVPRGIRNYENVTLHVARTTSGMGKTKMEKTKHARLPRLAAELRKELPEGSNVFLCVHKCAKDLAGTFSTEELPLHIGYWGAVDGKNDWQDCNVAVIFGLYWQDPTRPINNVFAIDGPKDASWLKAPRHGEHENILSVISQKDVSASVIQAINRICIRRVNDAEGRCAKAEVYSRIEAQLSVSCLYVLVRFVNSLVTTVFRRICATYGIVLAIPRGPTFQLEVI